MTRLPATRNTPLTWWLLRAAAAAVAVALLLAGCGHGARDETRIVFQSDRSGSWGIYAVRPDGSGLARVTWGHNGFLGSEALWSRDGRRFFVSVESSRESAAYVVDARTGRETRVRVHNQGGAEWSPDGKRLAVAGDGGIVVIDADGSHRRQVTSNWQDAEPAWSPDGKRIAYETDQRDLYTVDADGGEPSHVVRFGWLEAPQWSHQGDWIGFTRGSYETQTVYVVHPDGSGLRRLVRDADDWRWSPKEDVLAYTHANDLFRVNVDGTQRKALTSRGCCWLVTPAPAWSPDGRRIAYLRSVRAKGVRDPLAHDQIWVMNADGTEKRPVTRPFPDGGTNEFPRWVEGQVRAAQPQRALRLVSLPRRSVLRTAVPVGGLAAEGRRAAVEQGLGGGTEYPNRPGPLLVWEPDRGRVLRLPIRDCGSVLELVSAGRRLAYTCDNSGTDVLDQALRLVRLPGGRTHKVVRAVATHLRAPAGTRLRGLVGEGRLLAFALGRLVLLPQGGGWLNARTDIFSSGRKVASWRGEAQLVDADAEHVVVKLGQRAVVVVSGDGRTVRRFSFGRNQARGAAVDGRRLAVLLRGRLVVYDAGRRRASWPVVRGFGPPPVLEDVEGDLAVYVAGVAIHLVRLTDGRDIVIRIPHEAGPAFAELVPAGLFYAYNVAYSKPPGRVAFVTRADLLRALR